MQGSDGPAVEGMWTRGSHPKELLLNDGSRLRLTAEAAGHDGVRWRRVDEVRGYVEEVSIGDAAALAGRDFRDYVAVRTRAETEWLRALADWCNGEADRLDGELDRLSRAQPGAIR